MSELNTGNQYRSEIQKGGRITIPISLRKQFGLDIGDSVVLDIQDNSIRLRSIQQVVNDIQSIIKQHIPEGVSLVDELIQERSAEAKREEAEIRQSKVISAEAAGD